jgi:hypothetical protein
MRIGEVVVVLWRAILEDVTWLWGAEKEDSYTVIVSWVTWMCTVVQSGVMTVTRREVVIVMVFGVVIHGLLYWKRKRNGTGRHREERRSSVTSADVCALAQQEPADRDTLLSINKNYLFDPVVQSIENWLALMELACSNMEPKRKIITVLMHCNALRDRLKSAVYYQNLPEGSKLLREDVLKLAKSSNDNKEGKTLAILKIPQLEKEDVYTFGKRVREEIKGYLPGITEDKLEQLVLDCFVTGLYSVSLRLKAVKWESWCKRQGLPVVYDDLVTELASEYDACMAVFGVGPDANPVNQGTGVLNQVEQVHNKGVPPGNTVMRNENSQPSGPTMCFGCRQLGHIHRYCPTTVNGYRAYRDRMPTQDARQQQVNSPPQSVLVPQMQQPRNSANTVINSANTGMNPNTNVTNSGAVGSNQKITANAIDEDSGVDVPTATAVEGVAIFDNVPVRYLSDSGASHMIISRDCFLKLQRANPKMKLVKTTNTVRNTNGNVTVNGCTKIKLCSFGYMECHNLKVTVLERLAGYDCLLGRNIMVKLPKFEKYLRKQRKIVDRGTKIVNAKLKEDIEFSFSTVKEDAKDRSYLYSSSSSSDETSGDEVFNVDQEVEPPDILNEEGEIILFKHVTPFGKGKEAYEPLREQERETVSKEKMEAGRAILYEELKVISAEALDEIEPEKLRDVEFTIRLSDPKVLPKNAGQCYIPYNLLDAALADIKEQLDAKVIRYSTTHVRNKLRIVLKPTGEVRTTLDCRELNDCIVDQIHQLPAVRNLYNKLAKAQFFSKIDLKHAYRQIPMEEGSCYLTGFSCDLGVFEYCTMPMGIKTAPAWFQRVMEITLQEHIEWKYCCVYLDDIIIFTVCFQRHLEVVRRIIETLRQRGLKTSYKKSVWVMILPTIKLHQKRTESKRFWKHRNPRQFMICSDG